MRSSSSRRSLSGETRALLSLLRGGKGGATCAEPRFEGALDGERFLELATEHQVVGLAHWLGTQSANNAVFEHLSADVRDRLRHAYIHQFMRNEVTLEQAAELSRGLEHKGIECLFFKGPWMAQAAYPSLGTRPMDDLDLGVREADYRGAAEVLHDCGYRTAGELPADGSDALRQAHFSEQLRFGGRGKRTVELHFRMINVGPPSSAEPWLWENTERMSIGGCTVRVPGPTEMLLHLLVHANQHGFQVLRLLHDIRFVLERSGQDVDIERLQEHVERLHCGATAYFGLKLASELVGAQVDPDMLARFRPNRLRRAMFEKAWTLPRVRRLATTRRSQEVEAARLYLLGMGSMQDKLHYVRRVATEHGGWVGLARKALRVRTAQRAGSKQATGAEGQHVK